MTAPKRGRAEGRDAAPRIWVVDRVQGAVAVLLDDEGRRVDVPLARLPAGVAEGAVLRVPDSEGREVWETAKADEEQRRARRKEAEVALRHLRNRDPGGDVAL